jgi:hypothetical protein
VSDAHAEGDGHSPVGHVALIVGPGDRIPAERKVESSAAGGVE